MAYKIPTPVGRYMRTASDAISRIKITIVKINWIMDKMRTGNLGNLNRRLASGSETFDIDPGTFGLPLVAEFVLWRPSSDGGDIEVVEILGLGSGSEIFEGSID